MGNIHYIIANNQSDFNSVSGYIIQENISNTTKNIAQTSQVITLKDNLNIPEFLLTYTPYNNSEMLEILNNIDWKINIP